MLFCRLLIFSKSSFSKNSFRITLRLSSSLDPDRARLFVGPDLGPNCLQKFSADDTLEQKVFTVAGTGEVPNYSQIIDNAYLVCLFANGEFSFWGRLITRCWDKHTIPEKNVTG